MSVLRQFYISDPQTWGSNLHLFDDESGTSWVHLINYTDVKTAESLYATNMTGWLALPEVQAWITAGSHILISAGIRHESHATAWRTNPKVATLQHSLYEPNLTFGQLLGMAHKQFQQAHLDTLTNVLGIGPNHTVWDLNTAITTGNVPNSSASSQAQGSSSTPSSGVVKPVNPPIHPGVALSIPF